MEKAPVVTKEEIFAELLRREARSEEVQALVLSINADYDYWDAVKYKSMPPCARAEEVWRAVVAERAAASVKVWQRYGIHFALTNKMQQQCYALDLCFRNTRKQSEVVGDMERYVGGSLMEEAISSSQMEGAATTRKVAKEMLSKKKMPRDRSQQMIYNNYQTIQFIVANKDKALSSDLLLKVHDLITASTLDNAEGEGRFRQNDDVVVADTLSHEVVHTPPAYTELPQFVEQLCDFFNNETSSPFIHPIIKGIIIHFMVAYMHPFVDGNGRTARALFYWYMLREGYWMTEYLSISRIIYRSKRAYEKTFLYTEMDGNDMGYFIAYNLRVLESAYTEQQRYMERKHRERMEATKYLKVEGINVRQAEIVKLYHDEPKIMLTVKDLQVRFGITPTTAKSDLVGLVERGLLAEVALNKVKKGYVKGAEFDAAFDEII